MIVILALVVGLAMVASGVIMAAGDDVTYGITRWTVDGGGGTSTGDVYAVTGNMGQPDAGALSGGIYGLNGSGFWGWPVYSTYLPIALRD
jgi:hypothetical protein